MILFAHNSVGQEFAQITPGMAHLCSTLSEASVGVAPISGGWLGQLDGAGRSISVGPWLTWASSRPGGLGVLKRTIPKESIPMCKCLTNLCLHHAY